MRRPRAVQKRGQVLQRSWHCGAVDQGRQERGQMDEALLPHVQGQPDAVAVVCLGLQPGQLPASAGPSSCREALVADDATGEARQDRGEGDATLEVRDVPTSRSGCDAELVRSDPRPHRAARVAAAGRR